MKIVFLDAGTLGEGVSLNQLEDLGRFKAYDFTEPNETQERIKDVSIIITNKVQISQRHLENSASLKLVVSAATGTNHIDLEACEATGIDVKNVADYSTESVAQQTFAMLFHLKHSNEYFQNYTRTLEWEKSPFFSHLGRTFSEVKGQTWGIIGLGTIGKRVATIATCFGAKVIYYSSSGKDRSEEYSRYELDELLQKSDIVSIHSPLNSQTKNLLNSSNLSLLKDNAVLLNLGRGGIINEVDLVSAFDQSNILVGLDVLEQEPFAKDAAIKKLLPSERFFLSPHIAWSSVEARALLIEKIGKNISEFLKLAGK